MAHSRPSISSSYCALLLLLIASWTIPPHWLPCPANHFLSPFTYFCSLSSPKRSNPATTRVLSTLFYSHHTSRRGCGSPRHSEAAHATLFSVLGCALLMPTPASALPRHLLLLPPACVWHMWAHAFLPPVKPSLVGGEPRLPQRNQESKFHRPLSP